MTTLHCTEILGGEAYDVHGHFVGRVAELYIEPAEQPNRVARYKLSRGKYLPLLARHDQVSFVAPGVIRLKVGEKELEHFEANESWLAIAKDLLDQQIIDTRGRKVVRVNDINLAEQRTDGTVELRITDVDVGLTGATRRLLQGVFSPGLIRRIQTKLPARTILWEFVNLIEPDPLRRVKLRISHQKLEKMHPADLADIMEDLSHEERQAIIGSLDEQSAAEALGELDSRLTSQIVEKMEPSKAAEILEEMDPDQAADLLARISPQASHEVLEEMPGPEARDVERLLTFDENSAGGMMTTDLILVSELGTRREALAAIEQRELKIEQLDTIFLVDAQGKFAGSVAVGRLLLSADSQPLIELKSEPLLAILPDSDEKDVFEVFDKYNLRSLCVVSAEGRPIGAITVDDVVTHLRA